MGEWRASQFDLSDAGALPPSVKVKLGLIPPSDYELKEDRIKVAALSDIAHGPSESATSSSSSVASILES